MSAAIIPDDYVHGVQSNLKEYYAQYKQAASFQSAQAQPNTSAAQPTHAYDASRRPASLARFEELQHDMGDSLPHETAAAESATAARAHTGHALPAPSQQHSDREHEFEEYDDEEFEECEPVYIHWIRNGDTMAKIIKTYHTNSWLVQKANELPETGATLEGRRFLVIPSASTFQDPIWDVDQERHELCRNFLILIKEDDFGLAHTYLGRCNYNLPAAIENYYYDLC
ncbi:hypothetical protein BC831DRAFT_463775 [Entophlyctis helioformis]|nr:hypothetical protein BC831DRAFT_463775 [Entophlyctis helioformis]